MNDRFVCGPRIGCALLIAVATAGLFPWTVSWGDGGAEGLSGRSFVTRHQGTFNGEAVGYRAVFEDITITDDEGNGTASLYATSYIRENIEDSSKRPVIFVWNGGPTAASQPLHMAGFGPKRLVVPLDITAPIEAPYATRDNEDTILDVADLVFVDPAETGFSRILPGGDRAYFLSVDGDAESVAQFIRKWAAANGREDSPLYVLGASYGSIRAAVVARYMAEAGMPLRGALLFSQGVNLVETTQRKNSIIGYASNISQLAAIAWYYGRSAMQETPVPEVIETAQEFAMTDYLVALAKGNSIADGERRAIAARLAGLTGISAEYYLEHGLLITKASFRSELLDSEGLVLGSNDARYTAPAGGERRPASPTQGVGDVHRTHMHNFLGVTMDFDQYFPLAPVEFGEWDWSGTTTLGYRKSPPGTRSHIFADFDYPGALVPAFAASDQFRIFIATGYFDTLTTVGPARLLAYDVDFPADRVVMRDYAGGHAFYSNDAEFARLANDVRKFVLQDDP